MGRTYRTGGGPGATGGAEWLGARPAAMLGSPQLVLLESWSVDEDDIDDLPRDFGPTGPGPADLGPGADEAPLPLATEPDAGGRETLAGDAPSQPRSVSPYRRTAFAVARAVVVLAVGAVGYQAVVPSTHVVRARLARLVVTRPGVAAFDVKASRASVEQASQSGLAALVTAGKRSPGRTGIYSIEWTPSPLQAAGIVVFVLPDDAQASAVLSQFRRDQQGPQAYASDSLDRRSTFTVAGVPTSTGSVYVPSPKAPRTSPGLAVTTFREGRVVGLAEVLLTTPTQADDTAVASAEYSHLRQVEPGFTLQVVSRPLVPTVAWAAGAVVVALVAALGPVGWRRRRDRRERERQAELERLAGAPAHHIVKRRR